MNGDVTKKQDDAENATTGFVFEVVYGDDTALERLTLQEAAIAPQGNDPLVAKRFKLGRVAAKRCFKQLGELQCTVLRGDAGQPLFPQGFVGSISHTNDTAVAVVGRDAEFLSLGIDIENANRVLHRSIIERIGIGQEKQWIKDSPQKKSLMIFCAKESLYKALFPLHGKKMAFKDVATIWDEDNGTFICTLLTDFGAPWDAGATFLTLCQEIDGFIIALTAIEMPAI